MSLDHNRRAAVQRVIEVLRRIPDDPAAAPDFLAAVQEGLAVMGDAAQPWATAWLDLLAASNRAAAEFEVPGRDPRRALPAAAFADELADALATGRDPDLLRS